MNRRFVIYLCVSCVIASSALGQQTPREQAQEMLGGVGSYADNFDQSTIEAVVVPYETDTPPEAYITNSTMEAALIERISGDSAESQALSDTRDSFSNRPEIVLDPNGDLFERANYADEYAEDLLGGYFEGGGGLCQTGDFGSVETFQRLCRRYKDTLVESCSVYRDVWVDRYDKYRCEAQDARYLKQCEVEYTYSCNPTPICRQNAITITAPNNGSTSIGDPMVTLNYQGVSNSGCTRQDFSFNLGISSDIQISDFILEQIDYVGFAQLLINGVVIGTYPSGGTGGELMVRRTKISKNTYRDIPVLKIVSSSGSVSYTTLSTSCAETSRSVTPATDLLARINQPEPVGSGQEMSVQNSVVLRTVTKGRPIGAIRLRIQGACCDALIEERSEICVPVIR